MTTERRINRGQFRKGHDPRRHRFTRDECVKGFWAALDSIITRYPDAIDSSGRHIAFDFLKVAGRLNSKEGTR
ncbi:MAG TPA: hypothetical protein VJZ77_05945 [Blastocatellia bacterium]|nr:hypothetical protein [Blastocatellia bacterium]